MNKRMGHWLGAVAIVSTSLALVGCGDSGVAGAPGSGGAGGSGGSGGAPGNAKKSFAYTITNPDGENGIEAFARDPETGRLTHLGRTMTGGKGDPFTGGAEQHALVSDGERVFAVNPGSDEISAFAIEDDGSLTLLGTSPSGGRRPVSLTLHADRLFVVNEGNPPGADPSDFVEASYAGFTVRSDGTLEPIPGATVAVDKGHSPSDILFNHDGSRLVAARPAGSFLDSFEVGADGALKRTDQRETPAAFALAFSPTAPDQIFVALADGQAGLPAPGVAAYTLADDGTLGLNNVITDADQFDPCWLAVSPDGRYLWAAAFLPRTLTRYTIAADGAIAASGVYDPGQTGPGATDIALDPAGKFLYQLRAFDVPSLGQNPIVPEIHVLRVDEENERGGLTHVQTLALPDDLASTGVMGMLIVDIDR
ncbi:lactonase family protein [Sorangium sp. So ce131]|uniref:lactonase family protein n=1 Tax=Sorangium sp. So ce131 TaxID=3133282 RepID=UPI003F5EF4BB